MTKRPAFTLLELILAMAISVLVAGSLAASLYTAFHARTSALKAVELTRATDMAADAVTRELANCPPPTGVLRGVFEGVTDTLDFYTTGPEPKASVQGDIHKVEFALTPELAGGGQMLVRRVTSNLLAAVETTPPDEVICHNVNLVQFRYYDGTTWQDSWDSTQQNNTLPYAVQFTLELAPGSPGDLPRRTARLIPLSCAPPPPVSPFGGL